MSFVVSCMVRVEREDAASWESLLRWTQLVDRPLEFHGNLVCASAPSGKAIYCGKDVDLFKALAAINTDTVRGQWFIIDTGLGEEMLCADSEDSYNLILSSVHFRKATVDELLDYFSRR